MEYSLLIDISLIITAAALFGIVARYFKQPLIAAYVVAGAILGPLVFNVIENTNEIFILSELGIAFLLFGAGMEINLKKFKQIIDISVITAVIQVGLIVTFSYLIMTAIGLPFQEAIYIAIALAFSSTMLVVKTLSDSKRLNTLDGRIMIGILIVQDFLVIISLPLLQNIDNFSGGIIINAVISGAILVAVAFIAEKVIFGKLMKMMAKSHELLFLIAITTCFAMMGLASVLGFPIAIGAFIAGFSLSVFRYNIEIAGKINVLRDFFATIFFVTLGMQLIPFEAGMWEIVGLMVLIALILKPLIIMILLEILGYNPHISVTSALGLANLSEFSFIIASTGLLLNHIRPEIFSAITLTIMGTIIFTPYFLKYNGKAFGILKRMWSKVPFNIKIESKRMPEGVEKFQNKAEHIILIGCDRMGSKILEEIRDKKIIVVDYNPDIIEWLKAQKIDCIYGDVYNENVIEKLPLKHAKILIITIPDEEEVTNLINKAQDVNPNILIVAKAETIEDAITLYDLGADFVVLPEFVAGERICHFIHHIPTKIKQVEKYRKLHLKELEKELKQRGGLYASHLMKKILRLKK